MGIPARLVTGFLIKNPSNNRGYLTRNNRHARTEIRDGTQRIKLDATPVQTDNGPNANQNENKSDNSRNRSCTHPPEPTKENRDTSAARPNKGIAEAHEAHESHPITSHDNRPISQEYMR